MKQLILLAVTGTTILMSSCKKDVDITPPTISSFTLNEVNEDITVNAGEEMHVDVIFNDDTELREYKIDIHDSFDGHGHGKTSAVSRFSFLQTYAINGKQSTEHKDIDIPADAAAGPYHVVLRVLDAAGNEGEFAELDFLILHPDQPVVTVTAPDFTGTEVHAPKGSTFTLSGTVTDNVDIQEIKIAIKPEDDDHGSGKLAGGELYEAEFDLPGSTDTSWDMTEIATQGKDIIIPATAATGHYYLYISVKDAEGHMTVWKGKLHVM